MLQVGDHPFIKKPSCVSYNWVRIFPLSLLIQLDEASQKIAPGFRSFDLDVPITEDILNQITEGALISRMTRKIFKQKIQERLGIANPDPPSDPS